MSNGLPRRLPAEWERHQATWMAWPHHEEDWPGHFEPIPGVFAKIVSIISRFEPVNVLCQDSNQQRDAVRACMAAGANLKRCTFHVVKTDRCWTRDTSGVGVWRDGVLEWLGLNFNGWAKYENYSHDAEVAEAIARISGHPIRRAVRPSGNQLLVLEGGAFDANGHGALMVTEECLLSTEQERNRPMTKQDYEAAFDHLFGTHTTIWLSRGCVGDDTHGHIDDIARFIDWNKVVLGFELDPTDENHAISIENCSRLMNVGMRWSGFTLVSLPFPKPIIIDGQRVPASYLNFYFINGALLVPTFRDPADEVALEILRQHCPDRQVIGIDCCDLIWGLGAIHCATMQQVAKE